MQSCLLWMVWTGAILVVILLFVTFRAVFFGKPWTRVGLLATFTGLIGAGVGQAGWFVHIDEPDDQLWAISAGFAVGVMAGALLGVLMYWLVSYVVLPTDFDGSDAAIFLMGALAVSGVLAIPGVGAMLFWIVLSGDMTLVGNLWRELRPPGPRAIYHP